MEPKQTVNVRLCAEYINHAYVKVHIVHYKNIIINVLLYHLVIHVIV